LAFLEIRAVLAVLISVHHFLGLVTVSSAPSTQAQYNLYCAPPFNRTAKRKGSQRLL
jgi:hypothetical protein